MTAKELAKILYEELEKDSWGCVDPEDFGAVAEGDTSYEFHDAMLKVLTRVVARLPKPKKEEESGEFFLSL